MQQSKRRIALTERILQLQQTVADLSEKCELCRKETEQYKIENDKLKDYMDSLLASHFGR